MFLKILYGKPDIKNGAFCRAVFYLLYELLTVLKAVLVGLDHLLYHLTADRTCLTRGKVTVVALLEVYSNLAGSLHLKSFESFLCLRNYDLVTVCHFVVSPLSSFNRTELFFLSPTKKLCFVGKFFVRSVIIINGKLLIINGKYLSFMI